MLGEWRQYLFVKMAGNSKNMKIFSFNLMIKIFQTGVYITIRVFFNLQSCIFLNIRKWKSV